MTVGEIIKRWSVLMLASTLLACRGAPPAQPNLPPHPAYEMFPRASSPPPTCPGQYRIELPSSETAYFMGCWGEKPN
jgi:hypothetical protein